MFIALGITIIFFAVIYFLSERNNSARMQQVYLEDALKYIFNREEAGHLATIEGIKGILSVSNRQNHEIIQQLQQKHLITLGEGGLRLTADGRRLAMEIVRAHRIWETFLERETDLPLHQIHQYADQQEHSTRGAKVEAMAAHLGFPTVDPHGDPIPEKGKMAPEAQRQNLNEWEVGREGRIAHIEDEPIAVAREIFKKGFRVDDAVRVLERSEGRVRLEHLGKEHLLNTISAQNIHLAEAGLAPQEPLKTLDDLKQGEKARISALSHRIQGLSRRRLLDLGFTPGVPVQKILVSAFGGDPTVYQVRGAKIALRKNQAQQIFIQ